MPSKELTEMEQVELDFKKLQVRRMRNEMQAEEERAATLAAQRAQQVADFKKSEMMKLRKQAQCKHRKGGRNNNFAKGTDANYSININTYPDGKMVIMCTRCGKEVEKPNPKLRKTDRKLYDAMWAEWQKWLEYPTDNSPSGSKIFELVQDAA
jgi:hypothetical protein